MEHYDGPAFYRNNGRPATKTRVQTKVPAKTEKAPTKIATSNQKERLNGTSRAFSPRKVPRSLVEIGRASCRERVYIWVVGG